MVPLNLNGRWSRDTMEATILNDWAVGPLTPPRVLKGKLIRSLGKSCISCTLSQPYKRDDENIQVRVPE